MALLNVGTPAPSFKGQNLTGPEIDYDKLKGTKPIVLIFAPDQINPAQTTQTKTVYEKNKAEVAFVITSRQVPSVMMAKAFLQQLGVTFPVLYDPKQEVYKQYGVDKPAVIYAIDQAGNITFAQQYDPKALTAATIQSAVDAAKAG